MITRSSLKSLFIIFSIILIFSSHSIAQSISVVPQQPYMGKIPVGSKAVRQLSIYNLDVTKLNITSISLSAASQFKILNNPGTKTVGLAEYFILEIEFLPTSTGQFTTELTIVSNAASSPNKYTISGYGSGGAKPSFERIFGGVESDGVGSIQQLSDGGYLLGGSTQLPDREYSDFYLVRTNNLGEIQWTHSFGDEDLGEGIGQLKQNPDGSFLLFGEKQTYKGGLNDLYFAKLNPDKSIAWQNIFGGSDAENSGSFVQTSDGGFLLAGTTRSFTTSTQVYLIKVDQNGKKIWEKNFGGTGGDAGKKIIPTKDGNYMILGTTSSKGSGDFDVYLMKVNGNGDIIWDKTHGGSMWDEGTDIAELSDGSFIISGYSLSYSIAGGHDWLLLKVNESGDFVWRKVFGSQYQDYAARVAVANDGFVIAGTKDLEILPRTINDMLVIKTDFSGNEIWRSQFGGAESEGVGGLIVNSDGHYVIAGSTGSYSARGDAYLLNINTLGQITKVERSDDSSIPIEIVLYQNYPNPFNNQTKISYKLNQQTNIELSIQNILGQKILTLEKGIKSAGNYSLAFNSDGMVSGIYFCVLKTNNKILVNKMLLLK
ncbi:MAG: T9SS type A sorting domain-containing protein [Melioribacteraceae bacterium]|nr:T9SS type A sorting domain-containing protein [Melioribacteraceae bacterium]